MSNNIAVKMSMSGQAAVTAGLNQVAGAMSKMVMPLVGIAAGAFGLSKITSGLKAVVDFGGRLQDTSIRTGLAVDRLLKLEQAFEDAGQGAEKAGESVSKLQKQIGEAAASGKGGEFARIGLSISALAEMNPGQQFETVLKTIQALPTATERTAAAMSIFGRGGAATLAVDLKAAEESLGALPTVTARNASALDRLGDSLGRLDKKALQFGMGMFDLLADPSEGLAAMVDKLDFTKAGQRLGAFIRVGIDSGKDGTLSDFISLALELGIAKGIQASKWAWELIADFFSSPEFFYGITQIGVQLSTELVRAAYKFLYVLNTGIDTVLLKWDNTMNRLIAGWVSKALEPFTQIPGLVGKTATTLKKGMDAVAASSPLTWEKAFEQAAAGSAAITQQLEKELNDTRDFLLSWWADFWAMGGADTTLETKIAELKAKMEALIKARNALGPGAGGTGTGDGDGDGSNMTKGVALLELERKAKADLLALDEKMAKVEGDFTKTAAEKWPERLRLLREEAKTLRLILIEMEERAQLSLDPAEAEQIRARSDAYAKQLSGIEGQIGAMGPDPYSALDQVTAAMTAFRASIGTLAEDIGKVFAVMTDGLKTLADSTYDLLTGTAKIGEVWAKVGQTAIKSVLSIASQYIASKLAMMAVDAIASKRAQADSAANFAASAPAGISQAGAQGGWVGILTYIGVFAAAMAAITGLAGLIGGGFKGGGYTGDESADSVAGVVHGREFVFDAPSTAAWTPEFLEGMRRGDLTPSDVGSGNVVNIAAFDSRFEARQWANGQDEETWFVDLAKRTSHRWRA